MPFVQKWGSFQAMAALGADAQPPTAIILVIVFLLTKWKLRGDMSHVKWEHSIVQQQGSNPRHLHPHLQRYRISYTKT